MSNGVIQISSLGRFGRFGNQLFQYAFARGYAESIGARLETPPWQGRELFGLDDPPLGATQQAMALDELPKDGRTNIDLYGYFQTAKCFEYYTLSKLREWFTFTPELLDFFPPTSGVTAAHIRRGDYVSQYASTFCIIDELAYTLAMREHGCTLEAVTWVREDKPRLLPCVDNIWLNDFMVLFHADTLFRANSTFSWWAATLGPAKTVYSPVVEGLSGHQTNVKFVEGNHPRCVDLSIVDDYLINP